MNDMAPFKLDTVTVKPDQNRITGPERKVHLEPRVMEFLVHLVQRAGQVVTREELIESVWQGYPGADQALSNAASKLRHALEEAGGDREQLETIPKRGYRLTGPVTPIGGSAKWLDHRILWVLAIVLVLGYFAIDRFELEPRREASDQSYEDKSIAVLPFMDLSPEGDQDYFADGMSEELTNLLARIEDLRVVARTSSFKFKDLKADVAEIGEALNVATVLEGSVRKAGDRVRVTAQLNDTSTGYHLWSESYNGELSDIFEIQDQIAHAIVEELKLELLDADAEKLHSEATDSVTAYDLYLAGRHHLHLRSDWEHLMRARALFEQVIELDPDFAPAWSGLADTYSVVTQHEGTLADQHARNQRALEAAQKAVALGPELAEGHASLGIALNHVGELERSVRHLRKAVELSPGYASAHHWLGTNLGSMGRASEAVASSARAAELNPLHAITAYWYADALVEAGRYDEGRSELVRMLEFEPENNGLLDFLVRLSYRSGRFVEAHRWWTRWYDLYSDQQGEDSDRCCLPAVLWGGTRLEVLLGRLTIAASRLAEMRERLPDKKWFQAGLEGGLLNATERYRELHDLANSWPIEGLPPYLRKRVVPFKGRASLLVGDTSGAIEMLEPAQNQWGWERRSFTHALLAYAYLQDGRQEAARDLAAETLFYLEELEAQGNRRPELAYRKAMLLALLNRREEAFDALNQAYEWGWRHYHGVTVQPFLDELMGDVPRYTAFKQKVLADIERMRKEIEAGEDAG